MNNDDSVVYPTRYTKFQNVNTLWLFISKNFDAESTSNMYLGLKGEFTCHRRRAVKTVYEVRPTKASSDVEEHTTHQIS